jgi:hypothetical protein
LLVSLEAGEAIGFEFATEEDAALFGFYDLAELGSDKPEISVVSLGSYTQAGLPDIS